MHGSTSTAPIGLTDALHNLFRLVEREHQRIADLESSNAQLVAKVAELDTTVELLRLHVVSLTERTESERNIARVQRGRIDSLEMRMA